MIKSGIETAKKTYVPDSRRSSIKERQLDDFPKRNPIWLPLDLIFMSRPSQLFPILSTVMAGFIYSTSSAYTQYQLIVDWPLPLISILIITTLVSSMVFLSNQVYDRQTDAVNQKLQFLQSGMVTAQEASWVAVICGSIALFLAWNLSFLIFLIALINISVGIFYNIPPFSLKNRALPAVAVNVIGGFFAFLLGSAIVEPFYSGVFIPAISYGLAWGGIYALVAIPDLVGDASINKQTFAVRYGSDSTKIFSFILLFIAGIGGIISGDMILIITGLTGSVLLLHLIITGSNQVFGPVKYSFLILALGVVIFIPYYLILLAFLFFSIKMYYQVRFRINYPNFSTKT